MLIRQADPRDIDGLVGLLGELFAVEADFAFDPGKQRRGLTALLARPRDACVLVCEIGGAIAGMCTVQALISTAEGGRAGLVEDVVVAAPWRGKGLGTALIAAAEAWSAKRGLTRLQLLADAGNAPALDFYSRRGWSATRLIALRKLLSGGDS